ncbi:MAG: metal ABC transporter ATP-binding protein [Alloprevotella sp.]|nr:metal ABC transporter ATP-binding protein [Alloprevotella sp.]
MNTLLRLEHIEFSYESHLVLHDISAQIDRGDLVVMTGSNGSGKTTLLRLMAGLLTPTSGLLERSKDLRIGYLPQRRAIDRQFPISVGQLVCSGLQNRKSLLQRFDASHRERVSRMLQQMQIEPLADTPIRQLSGGQFQRALIARALVSEPDLILLDEPDTHLDQESRSLLYRTLAQQRPASAVVMVSHETPQSDTTIWQLDDGRLTICRPVP